MKEMTIEKLADLLENKCRCCHFEGRLDMCFMNCKENLLLSLKEEYKPTYFFEEEEKSILRLVDSKFNWLLKNRISGEIRFYENKPVKDEFGKYHKANAQEQMGIAIFHEQMFKGLELVEEPCEFRRYL